MGRMSICRNIVGFAIIFLLWPLSYLRGVDSQYIIVYFDESDLAGLQSLWGAWNGSTPYTSSNLLNWHTGENAWPCYNNAQNWRGVTCLRYNVNETIINTWVVGLELDDASIGGTLPPGISQLNHLVSLTLTGNPNLKGNLPTELAGLPLNILDLHDNGFNGTFPSVLSQLDNLLQLDLSGNQFSGGFPTQFGTTLTLQVFNIARNFLQGNIPQDFFANMTQLLILDLSGNGFTGSPPNLTFLNSTLYNLNLSGNAFTGLPELSQLFNGWLPKSLGVLDLSGLYIGGSLPEDWSSPPDLLSLEELYLDNISISGVLDINSIQSSIQNLTKNSTSTSRTLQVLSLMNNSIADVLFDKQFLLDGQIKFFLQGNPYCKHTSKDPDGIRCFCEQYCAISEAPKKIDWKAIVIPIIICVFLLGCVILYLAVILHGKNKHVHILLKRFEESGVRAKRFEYNELRAATKNFAEERKLGQGAYGAVYKGILTNNIEVAVKQLFMKTQQASEDFLNEVLLISNLQHRNLVALKGYCFHGKEMLLVYEFVDYCDLDKLLLQGSKNALQVVSWPERMRICLGVAQGLYYLHASSQTKIIHRDIKASNILLDKHLNAKIADFGLARPIEDERTEIMTQQRAGTLGYLAPEYALYGQLSEKADVYSFGVLLLEIVSGTRNQDPSRSEDEVYLPTRAGRLHREDKLMEIMDPRLHVNKDEAVEVRRVLEVAIQCVQSAPEGRPTMFRVVTMLAGDAANDVSAATTEEYNNWPEYQMPAGSNIDRTPSGLNAEQPLFVASSSTTGSTTTGLITSSNSTIELSSLFTR